VAGVGRASWPVHISHAIEGGHRHRHAGFQIDVHARFVDHAIHPPDDVGDGERKRGVVGQRQRHVGFEHRKVAGGPKLHGGVAEIVHIEGKLHQRPPDGGSSQNRRQAGEPYRRAHGKEGGYRIGIQGVQRAKVPLHARRQELGFASYGDWSFRQVCEARPSGNGFRGLC
jgi:hypothetical protein